MAGAVRTVAVGSAAAVAIGLGAGWGAGTMLLAPATDNATPSAAPERVVDHSELSRPSAVVALPPLLTNLAGNEGAWARLELAAVFAEPPEAALVDRIHADALAYLRTVSVPEVATPSGYAFLRADLAARARDVSEGAVTDVLVRAFLVE